MPVYKYFGAPAKYHGKPLFHILSNLKNFGRGRIISRAGFNDDKPSFYRILFAQPLMDNKSEEGRAIVEKVLNGVRYTEPVDLSQIASLPDFILVAKRDETSFCKWDTLRDYSPEVDVVVEPEHYTMPPLLRLLMERDMVSRGETPTEDKFLLPHYKTYIPKDRVELEPGKEEVFQETITKFSGTVDYNFADQIGSNLSFGARENVQKVIDDLPEESPFPTPFVGMRLAKLPWSHMTKNNKEDKREI